MRIAMISHSNSPWAPHYGRWFQNAGHEVIILSFHPDPIEGVNVIPIGAEQWNEHKGKFVYLTAMFRVRRLLRDFRPDVVFAPYLISNGLTAALTWRGPLVVSARGGDVLIQAGRTRVPVGLRNRLIRFICRRADRIHAVSDQLAEAVASLGINRELVECFPMGVDIERFKPRPDSQVDREPLHLICTRRHKPVYQTDVVIRALALLRDQGLHFRATIMGGGHLLDERRRQVNELRLNDIATITGETRHDQLPKTLADSDIYISASASDGTSSSLLEAMACKVFPVVSDIPANHGWVQPGETGYFFESTSAEELAQKVALAAANRELRTSAGEVNRQLVEERGSHQKNMTRLLHLLERVAGGAK